MKSNAGVFTAFILFAALHLGVGVGARADLCAGEAGGGEITTPDKVVEKGLTALLRLQQPNAVTTTSKLYGSFLSNPAARAEFFQLISATRGSEAP